MSQIKALIVDDEPLARDRLRSMLENDSDIEVIDECADGCTAVATIEEKKPDLVFLDVQMPELDGFGVIEAVGAEQMPTVLFCTAHDQYALKAFEVQALDYLLKPYSRERFDEVVGRAKRHIHQDREEPVNNRLVSLLEDLQAREKYTSRLVVKSTGRVVLVRVSDVDWFEAAGNYVRLHVGQESHLLRETMNSLESRLEPSRFLRIHRSTIANVDRIKELQPTSQGEYVVTLVDGTKLTLSRRYREKLKTLLGKNL